MTDAAPFWLGGHPTRGRHQLAVTNPYDGSVVGRVHLPTTEHVERAVADADAVAAELAAAPAWARSGWLTHVADRLRERAEEAAQLVTAESGKPITWARAEIARAASTFQ